MNKKEEQMTKEEQEMVAVIMNSLPKHPVGMNQYKCAKVFGLDPKTFRLLVRKIRKSGIPICSNSKDGYWMAANSKQVDELIQYYKSYVNSMRHTIKQLEVTYHKMKKKEDRRKNPSQISLLIFDESENLC